MNDLVLFASVAALLVGLLGIASVGASVGAFGRSKSDPSVVRYRIKESDGLWYGEIYHWDDDGWLWFEACGWCGGEFKTSWSTREECEQFCQQQIEYYRSILRRAVTPWSEPKG